MIKEFEIADVHKVSGAVASVPAGKGTAPVRVLLDTSRLKTRAEALRGIEVIMHHITRLDWPLE